MYQFATTSQIKYIICKFHHSLNITINKCGLLHVTDHTLLGTTAESGAKYGCERCSHVCLGCMGVLRQRGKHGIIGIETDDCAHIPE